MPKLVRALGEPATRPPDVVVIPLTADATVVDLVRHVLARSVAQILRHDPGVRLGDDPEDVHQLRVGARRLRSDLRSFAPLLERDRLVPYVPNSDGSAPWLALCGTPTCLPTGWVPTSPPWPDRCPGRRPAVAPSGGRGRRSPLGNAQRPAQRPLRGLSRHGHRPRRHTAVQGVVRAHREVAPSGRREDRPWAVAPAGETVDGLGPEPSDAELHQVRIMAKRCRYAAEAVAPIVEPAAYFAAAVADVQTVLGDHQDTVVAESWLRHAAAAIPNAGVVAGQLIALERSQRLALRVQWPAIWHTASSKKLRRWL